MSEVLAYFEMYGIHGIDEREHIHKRLRVLDATFCRVIREKMAAARDKKTKS